MDNLEQAYEKMQSTVEDLKTGLFESGKTVTMDNDNSTNSPFLDMVVFTTLTCRDMLSSLELILEMHGKELEIKRKIVDDYEKYSLSEQSNGGSEKQSKEYWMVHITAWAMDVEIDKEFVTSAMKQIASDASLSY